MESASLQQSIKPTSNLLKLTLVIAMGIIKQFPRISFKKPVPRKKIILIN